MSDYIKREDVLAMVAQLPAADVVEQKTGKWMPNKPAAGDERPRCSVCQYLNPVRSRYCPHCGAKMEEQV